MSNLETTSLKGIESQLEKEKEDTEVQIEKENKTIRDTEAGLHAFENIKKDVLEETFEVLEKSEGDFYDLSTDLVKEHEMKIEECTDYMVELEELIEKYIKNIEDGKQKLLIEAQKMRDELAQNVNESIRELVIKEGEHEIQQEKIKLTRERIDQIKNELKQRLENLRPQAG